MKGSGTVYKRGPVYWIKYYRNGVPYRESSGSHKESDAKKLLTRRLGEISVGKFIGPEAEKILITQLADDFVSDYRTNGKRSLDKAERALRPLLAVLGDCKAHRLTTDRIRAYVQSRQQHDGVANATINRELAALKRMYNLGLQAEKIFRKPHIPMLQENNVRKGFFEHWEFVGLRNELREYVKPIVTFAYYTGWRSQEILTLRWNQVDLDAKTVRLDPGTTKNREGRTVFLDGELLTMLNSQWEKRRVTMIGDSPTLLTPYVFHHNGQPIRDFRSAWMAACKRSGLEGKIFHDFRRTAVRNMVRAGVPERVAMKVSGHKTRSVFDRYNIVSEGDLREAAQRISMHAEAQTTQPQVAKIR